MNLENFIIIIPMTNNKKNKNVMTEKLSFKQFNQLVSLCKEFQPHSNTEAVVFLEVINAAREFCDSYRYPFVNGREKRFDKLLIGEFIKKIKSRYYFNGIKYANGKREFTNKQYFSIIDISKRPTAGIGVSDYIQAEKELFMKIIRACRDYMRSKMNKEAEHAFFERLNVIYETIRP